MQLSATEISEEHKQMRDPLPHEIPLHASIRGFEKWPARTSTSPLDKHLCMHHTPMKQCKMEEKEDSETLGKGDKTLRIQIPLMNLAMRECTMVHNAFLKKIPVH